MVNPGQRMTNTMREPTGFANSDMRMGDGRNENRRENRHHESLSFMAAVEPRRHGEARVDLQAQAWSLKQGHESVHCVRKFDRP